MKLESVEEDGIEKFVLKDYDAEVKFNSGFLSNKINTLKFVRYKNIPCYKELLMTLRERVLLEREKVYRFKGIFDILLAIGLLILVIYFLL